MRDALDKRDDIVARQGKALQEHSKLCKRLEKDNEALRRQKEATAANIIRMAEERQDWKNRMDHADKKTEKLMSIIQAMQAQDRKVPPAMASTLERIKNHQNLDEHGEESDYSDDDDEDDDQGSDQDDTEEEASPTSTSHPPQQHRPAPNKVPYGPERPPIPHGSAAINGH